MIGFLFATLLLPMFSRMLKTNDSIARLTKTAASLVLVGSITVSIVGVLFANELMHLLYIEAAPYWAEVFSTLLPTFIGMSSVYIYGTLLTANGSLKSLNTLAFGGVILNVILNWVLIPMLGALGAALATLVTQSLVAVLHYWIALRSVDLGSQTGFLIKLIIFPVLLILCSAILKHCFQNWLGNMALILATAAVLSYAIGLIRFSSFRDLAADRE